MQITWARGIIVAIGITAFVLLAIAQYKLFEQRMIVDSAVSTFIICNTGFFDITESRIVIGLNQILPVIYSYFTNDVKDIVTAFYFNDYLFYILFFLLFLFRIKQPAAALALIFGYFALLSYNYCALTYEVPLSWPFLILLSLVIEKKALTTYKPWQKWLTVAVCLFFLAFSSPIITVATGMFLAYFAAEAWNTPAERRKVMQIALAFGGLVLLKNYSPNAYDVKRVTALGYEKLAYLSWHEIGIWAKNFLLAFPYGSTLIVVVPLLAWKKLKAKQPYVALVFWGSLVYTIAIFIAYGIPAKSPFDELVSKAMAPMMLLFCYVISKLIFESKIMERKLNASFVALLFLGFIGWKYHLLMGHYTMFAEQKVALTKELIKQAPTNGSMHYIDVDDYSHLPLLKHINPSEVIISSALTERSPHDVQIVVADSMAIKELLMLSENEVYHMPGSYFDTKPNNGFFHFKNNLGWQEYQPVIGEPN